MAVLGMRQQEFGRGDVLALLHQRSVHALDVAADSERQFVFGTGFLEALADARLELFRRGVPEARAVVGSS